MKKFFLSDFEGCTEQEIRNQFEDYQWVDGQSKCNHGDLGNLEILLAWYGSGGYDGTAFVLCRDRITGCLFEVNGSHCSCYGLEGQW